MAGPRRAEVLVGGTASGLSSRVVRRAVHEVLRGERRRIAVSVVFVGAATIRRLNAAWLHHDRPTDVVTFPLRRGRQVVGGEIYICRRVAASEARRHRVPVREELLRLIVHGTLHLLGWDHPEGKTRTKSPMWHRQERYVAELR